MKTNRLSKAITLLLLWLWGACSLLAQSNIQVVWENSDTELLLNEAGILLKAGAQSNRDGCVLQLGYYTNATSLNPFAGEFIALTGEGSANSQYSMTAVGDSGGQAAGRFSVSTTFRSGSTTSGQNFPAPGTPLAIRFFNSSTIATSTCYNAVSAGAKWAWRPPAISPGELLLLSLGDEGIVWLGGPASALSTTLPSAVRFDSQPLSVTLNPDGSTTLSVGVSGILPATFQWRKNGSVISGANSASYTLSNVQPLDAGSYDVVVTNLAGAATSSAALISVNTPVSIVSQPSGMRLNTGDIATFSVSVTGTGPINFQWRKNGIPLVGGTLATFSVVAQPATEGNYDVIVSNTVNSIPSIQVPLSVLKLPTLSQTIDSFRMIRGSAATLLLSLDSQNLGTDAWQLFRVDSSVPVVSGSVNSVGTFEVPLRYITVSGDYVIRTSRKSSDGSLTSSAESSPFHIDLLLWDSIAGIYEALLADDTHVVKDGAFYRGVLGFSVTRYGYASGRLRFNEPNPIPNAADPALRNYTPVLRTFVTGFTPIRGNPSLLQATLRLGTGLAAGREELLLQLDLTAGVPKFSAVVNASNLVVPDTGLPGFRSVATECLRQIGSLSAIPIGMRGALGRYTLAADSSAPSMDQAHLLLTFTSSGSLLWLSRRPGYTGSGSTQFSVNGENFLSACIYEAQMTAVRSISSILMRSWLGKIRVAKTDLGVWRVGLDPVDLPDALELQSCCLTNTAGLISIKGEDSNWSKVQTVPFSKGIGCAWNIQSSTASFLRTPSKMLFHLQNPLGYSYPQLGESFWNVAFSASGSAFFERITISGVTPGLMIGQVDRITGSWLGIHLSPAGALRYRVYGVAHDPYDSPSKVATGWVEYGSAPFLSVGTWNLQSASEP